MSTLGGEGPILCLDLHFNFGYDVTTMVHFILLSSTKFTHFHIEEVRWCPMHLRITCVWFFSFGHHLDVKFNFMEKIRCPKYKGVLYTRSQGQCSTQLKHSYWWKNWNQPQGLYTRNWGWTRKMIPIFVFLNWLSSHLLITYWLVLDFLILLKFQNLITYLDDPIVISMIYQPSNIYIYIYNSKNNNNLPDITMFWYWYW
jgi:hypothetical protein